MNKRGKQIETGSGSGSGENRRMYNCNICMGGFTNPQALGGHRNLHRRDRRTNLSSSSSQSSPISYVPLPSQSFSTTPNFTNPNLDNNPPPYFPTTESYHHQEFQPPVNTNYSTQSFGSSSSSVGRNYAHEEFLGLDLSLGLGSMNVDEDTQRRPPETGGYYEPQDDDLDLDLQLGSHRHR